MIGIIGAMEEEVAALLEYTDIRKTNEVLGYKFYEGTISKKDVVIVQGGIGKVNATISTTLLLKEYLIDYVINIGSAGGLSLEENVGDVVISSSVVHHDVDVTAFGRAYGEVPGLPRFYVPDEELVAKAKDIMSELNIPYHFGLIASGDQFIHASAQVNVIKEHFKEALCSEMEAASIAQTCYVFNKPFIITRSLSDVFDKGNSSVQFDEYLKKASASSAIFCKELISRI